jgi:predicted hydrocarbon binding protein
MRDMDRPEEVLEAEDLTLSMPRRFGLSDVVGVQIRRFQEEVRQKRLQAPSPVLDLMRLVLRRPDAEAIFEEAGRRVARHLWGQRSAAMRRTIRLMPSPISRIAAQRAARRMFARLGGGSKVSVARWPAELQIQRPLTARADPGGAACAFYAGAFSEVMTLYTGRRYRILHPRCAGRGDPHCGWSVEVSG